MIGVYAEKELFQLASNSELGCSNSYTGSRSPYQFTRCHRAAKTADPRKDIKGKESTHSDCSNVAGRG